MGQLYAGQHQIPSCAGGVAAQCGGNGDDMTIKVEGYVERVMIGEWICEIFSFRQSFLAFGF